MRLRFAQNQREGCPLQVLVRDNNVDQALRVLKKKMQREGLFREMKQRRSYEKPSERKTREKSEAIRRARKLARKKAQREGLIPDTRKKKIDDKRNGQRPGMGGGMGGGMSGGMGGGRGAGDRPVTPRF
jgi:small subunit ribosomal protein S21